MKVVASLSRGHRSGAMVEASVIERILRHCGLLQTCSPRASPAGDCRVHDPEGVSDSRAAAADGPRELWTAAALVRFMIAGESGRIRKMSELTR